MFALILTAPPLRGRRGQELRAAGCAPPPRDGGVRFGGAVFGARRPGRGDPAAPREFASRLSPARRWARRLRGDSRAPRAQGPVC